MWAMMASLTILMMAPQTGATGDTVLRVRIVRGLPATVLEQVRVEVDEIWRRHRITIEWVATELRATTDRPDLIVGFADRPPTARTPERRRGKGPIAWIMFHDGRPTSFIQISQRAALAVLDSRSSWDGLPTTRSMPEMRDRALGRIIGRALAHEIGHYLLGSNGHASSGLMRASLPDEELVAIGRIRMTLDTRDAKVLRTRLQSTMASAPLSARCK